MRLSGYALIQPNWCSSRKKGVGPQTLAISGVRQREVGIKTERGGGHLQTENYQGSSLLTLYSQASAEPSETHLVVPALPPPSVAPPANTGLMHCGSLSCFLVLFHISVYIPCQWALLVHLVPQARDLWVRCWQNHRHWSSQLTTEVLFLGKEYLDVIDLSQP